MRRPGSVRVRPQRRFGVKAASAGGLMLLVLLAGVLAGCAGASSAASPVATAAVDLPPSYRFAPAAITVTLGTTVNWTNHDNFTHSVQFLDGGLPTNPQLIGPGQATTVTFTSAGLFHYQCSLHPQDMRGSVLVTGP